MSHLNLGDAGRIQGQVERLLNVRGGHGLEQLPGNDVAGVIVQDSGQVIPAPADDAEIGVSSPEESAQVTAMETGEPTRTALCGHLLGSVSLKSC